ncbi:MAG: Trp biosynthesis-associated membrane protein [Propionibacteriales bacterium]|nr:Trp biosynthesis-associated membrane protein [Propionibacteriales bacterium]
MTARRGWPLAAHLILALAGLGVLLWPVTLGANPTIMCREQVMQPGDRCAKADGESEQTYEERLDTRRTAVPVIMVVGAVMIIFAGVLVVGEVRRTKGSAKDDQSPPSSPAQLSPSH